MTYLAWRRTIRSGDLLLYRERGTISRIIRTVTESDYSHVAVAWVTGDRVMALEARFRSGVSMRMVSETLPCDWISTGCAWTASMESYALSRLETGYSVLGALRAGLGMRTKEDELFCSSYAADVLDLWLATESASIPRDGLTPDAIARYFLARGCPLRMLSFARSPPGAARKEWAA